MSARTKTNAAIDFLQRHITTYSMYGKTVRNGVLVFFVTGEPCETEAGQAAHARKISETLKMLEAMRTP